jgi:hypothetical protein
MGWLFSQRWPTRKDLIDHLVKENSAVETLKHCCVGNNLWCVHRTNEGDTFICLYMMQLHRGNFPYWGYKDIDESMGPYQVNCPLSYLEGLSAAEGYAIEWRKRVREYHARRNRKLDINDKVRLPDGREFQVCATHGNAGYSVTQLPHQGLVYRLKRSQLSQVEIFK